METIYKKPEYRPQLAELTAQARLQLPGESHSHMIETDFGASHVLEIGDSAHPKLILLHGGATNSAMALKLMAGLIPHFHIFAPDIPGNPGQSAQTFLDPGNDESSRWLNEGKRSTEPLWHKCQIYGISTIYAALFCRCSFWAATQLHGSSGAKSSWLVMPGKRSNTHLK
jgi:pimeloyl-ACP methyl ester carboxylesterase